jgi:hypothetical protein
MNANVISYGDVGPNTDVVIAVAAASNPLLVTCSLAIVLRELDGVTRNVIDVGAGTLSHLTSIVPTVLASLELYTSANPPMGEEGLSC